MAGNKNKPQTVTTISLKIDQPQYYYTLPFLSLFLE